MSTDLHADLTVFDGLVLTSGGRTDLEHMIRGGLTAANATCSVWEGFQGTMERIARWKRSFVANSDIAMQVLTAADIRRAKAENKVGIVLGWQNTSAIEDQLPFIQLFHDVGVRVAQLTYNTQNLLGCGCYESRDGGLSDFGREAIDEFNRVGILIDLSHVGTKTCADTIEHSKQPVCYTHVACSALKDHPRNKSDDQLRQIADKGGFIGATCYTPFLRRGPEATMDDFIEVAEHVINVAGEENVGFGTDVRQNYQTRSIYPDEEENPLVPDYWVKDKGYARRLVNFPARRYPAGYKDFTSYGLLTAAMEKHRWPEARIRRVMGENWVAFLGKVWRS